MTIQPTIAADLRPFADRNLNRADHILDRIKRYVAAT